MPVRLENGTYYDILHVRRDAPVEIIRASYRTLMQQLKRHPDLGGDAGTAALINEAYAVLTDSSRRAAYDAQLDAQLEAERAAPNENHGDATARTRPDNESQYSKMLGECMFCGAPHESAAISAPDAVCTVCASPLGRTENRRLESSDQRAVARIDKRQTIVFYTQWPQRRGIHGRTEDISLNGLRFSSYKDLKKGQRIKIVSNVVEAVACVTHCSPKRRGLTMKRVAGVSFITHRFIRSVGGFISERI